MAQLVKFYDCISRYETNPFHYPTQFIRLKQERWQVMQNQWKKEALQDETLGIRKDEELKQPKSFWSIFKKQQTREETVWLERELPKTKVQLTQHFLNQLYPFQIKWATSSLSHYSKEPKATDHLKYLMQRFPDIYLIMYHPIFNIKSASVESDIIMISPIGIDIIHQVQYDPASKIIVTDERTWTIEHGATLQKKISPLLSFKRTERIVKSILQKNRVDFPIKKTVVAPSNHFVVQTLPYQTILVDKKDYAIWFEEKRSLTSPLKSIQLKAMAALLEHCQTTAYPRQEWDEERKDEG